MMMNDNDTTIITISNDNGVRQKHEFRENGYKYFIIIAGVASGITI